MTIEKIWGALGAGTNRLLHELNRLLHELWTKDLTPYFLLGCSFAAYYAAIVIPTHFGKGDWYQRYPRWTVVYKIVAAIVIMNALNLIFIIYY